MNTLLKLKMYLVCPQQGNRHTGLYLEEGQFFDNTVYSLRLRKSLASLQQDFWHVCS